jgi:attachment invasion locus protein
LLPQSTFYGHCLLISVELFSKKELYMQRVFSPWIMAALLFSPALAVAMESHTLSVGYAQTHLSALKKSASKDLRGLTLKYRYEFNSDWGC